jgi:hypothetical protein
MRVLGTPNRILLYSIYVNMTKKHCEQRRWCLGITWILKQIKQLAEDTEDAEGEPAKI